MGVLWSLYVYKQTPLRSVNWIYLVMGQVWYFLKSFLIANLDEEPLPAPSHLPPHATESRNAEMASVVVQDNADLRLALPVERASTSPFPSPGSPFYPPPRLGAHEFASRPSSSRSSREDKNNHEDKPKTMPRTDGASTPTTTPSLSVTTAISPSTPTPNSVFSVKTPTTQITVPDPPPNSDSPVSLNAAAAALASNRDSLTSSRPAPPSPATSRRTSAALSRHSSSARSHRQSKASFLQPQPQPQPPSHEPEASTSTMATLAPKRKSLFSKIRDFAFPPSDDRHMGKGPDVPRANRPRRRWSTYSSASASSIGSSHDEDEDEDGGGGGWGGSFRWNTLGNRFSWGAGQVTSQENGPSHTDFARNFGASEEDLDDGDEDYDYEDVQAAEDGDEPLVPGLYRAIYAFEPEGTAEMALEEEQVVRVVGRGGGVGWAIVEKDGGGQALVPESYLELIEAE